MLQTQFDHEKLKDLHGTELPDSVHGGQRLTGFTAGQKSKPVASSKNQFRQHGQSGTWVSELLLHTAKVVDIDPGSKASRLAG